MESSYQIRFVDGAGIPRAARVSSELWEKLKPELWELRNDRRTLDDIIGIMKEKHGFAPSSVCAPHYRLRSAFLMAQQTQATGLSIRQVEDGRKSLGARGGWG